MFYFGKVIDNTRFFISNTAPYYLKTACYGCSDCLYPLSVLLNDGVRTIPKK